MQFKYYMINKYSTNVTILILNTYFLKSLVYVIDSFSKETSMGVYIQLESTRNFKFQHVVNSHPFGRITIPM